MPRFVVFSDVHAHPFPYEARPVPYPPFEGEYNSRLISTVRALEEVADYAVKHGITTALFCGDLFHTRQSVRTDSRTFVSHVIKTKFTDRGIKLVMLPGNHDYYDRAGSVHALQSFEHLSNNIDVLDEVCWGQVNGLNIVAVPYTDDLEKAKKGFQEARDIRQSLGLDPFILLGHIGVQGAKVGSDYVLVSDHDISVDDTFYQCYDLCLFGHYHQHQLLAPNTYYVGALTQQNWGDVGGARGFLDIDMSEDGKEYTLTRIETSAPKFVVCSTEEELAAVKPTDFVTYLSDKVMSKEEHLSLQKKCNSTNNLTVKNGKKGTSTVVLPIESLSVAAALEPWVDANAGSLDKAELLSLGKRLLAEGGYEV